MRFLAAIPLLLAHPALAVPAQFTHQGRILDDAGEPLDGSAEIGFRLMDSSFGGGSVWEDVLTVVLDNGYYAAVLGTDEDTNPLDTDVLEQAPLWLEIQLVGEPAMVPRTPVHSVPYATMATVAEEVAGGPVDASEISVEGTPVIDSDGTWIGPTPSIDWSDLTGMPADFADGIDDGTGFDSFESLGVSCLDGDVPKWNAVFEEWACDIDAVLSGDDVRAHVTASAIELASGSTVDGAAIMTGEDDDTLAATVCTEDGQVLVYDVSTGAWLCGADTDTTLSADEVKAMIEAMTGLVLEGSTTVGGETMLTASSVIDWSQIDGVPDGVTDGDGDTLAGLDCEEGMIPRYRSGAWTCEDMSAAFDADSDGALTWVDCDDSDPDIHPDATEIWYDGVDQDCDGASDDDADGDGHDVDDDCDDTDPSVHVLGDGEACPAASCKALLEASPGTESGTYWLSMGSTTAYSAYCDMDTDDGGWTRVMSVDGTGTLNRTSDVPDGMGFARDTRGMLNEDALGDMYTSGSFEELRMRCSKSSHGRVFHIKTSSVAVIRFLVELTTDRPLASGSFTRLGDDSSHLGSSPSTWAEGRWGNAGVSGDILTNHPVYRSGTYHWIAGHDSRWECDDRSVTSPSGGEWAIYVR